MISDQQMKALHVGLGIIADQLNELGHGMHVVLNTKRDKYLINNLTQIAELGYNDATSLAIKAITYLESKETIHISWDKDRVKDGLFKPIIKALFNIDSTTKLNTTQLTEAWDKLIEHLLKNGYLEQAIEFPHIKE